MKRFEGKVVLVTGGGAGIGRAAVLAFAREGASVMIGDLDGAAEQVLREVQEQGGTAKFTRCDVTSPSDVEALVAGTASAFGGLDVAFNNAGVEGICAPTEDYPLEAWNTVLAVNLTGVFLCMRAQIPYLIASGNGAIVNTASIFGHVGISNAPAYIAARHGVIGLTKAAALENAARGVHINAVSAAFTESAMLVRAGVLADPTVRATVEAMHPIKRLARPEEVAAAVLWLASDEASFVTGTGMLVDGGFVSR